MSNPENEIPSGEKPTTSKPNEQPETPQIEEQKLPEQQHEQTEDITVNQALRQSKLSQGVFNQQHSQFRNQAKQVLVTRLNKDTKDSKNRIIEEQQRLIERLQEQLKFPYW